MDEPIQPSSAALEAAIEETDEQIGDVEEMLAEHAIASELRHEEILEGVETCRANLETLQQQLQQTPGESPVLNRILTELEALRSQVTALQAKVEALPPSQSPSPSLTPEDSRSIPQPSPSPNPPSEGAVLPEDHAPATPKRKKRRLI